MQYRGRTVLDTTTTPDGEALELATEGEHYVIRVGGLPLMSSAAYGSEQQMATVAAEAVGRRERCRVLIGGLGLGFTLRAALTAFRADAQLTVAELLPPLIRYHRGPVGHLAGHPLRDPRVRLYEGDVREPLAQGDWDAVLLDVDNGPEAFTARTNRALYDARGADTLARALRPGGILVVWSAHASEAFEETLKGGGLCVESRRVRPRAGVRDRVPHTLFIGRAAA